MSDNLKMEGKMLHEKEYYAFSNDCCWSSVVGM